MSTTLVSLGPAHALEDGAPLPCNSLCRSWMSMGEPAAAPAAELHPAAEQPPVAPPAKPIANLQAAKPKLPARVGKADRAPASAVAVLPPRRPTAPIETHPVPRKLAGAAPVPPLRPIAPEPKVEAASTPAAEPAPAQAAQSAPAMIAAVEVPSVPEPKIVLPPAPEPPAAVSPPPPPVVAAPEPRPAPVVAMASEPVRTAELSESAVVPSPAAATPVSAPKTAPMGPPPIDVIAALLLEMPRTRTPSP